MKIQGKQTVSEQRALSDVKAKLEQLIENTPAKGGNAVLADTHSIKEWLTSALEESTGMKVKSPPSDLMGSPRNAHIGGRQERETAEAIETKIGGRIRQLAKGGRSEPVSVNDIKNWLDDAVDASIR